jgi:hypothetical protein
MFDSDVTLGKRAIAFPELDGKSKMGSVRKLVVILKWVGKKGI